jgi:hypothetical protein
MTDEIRYEWFDAYAAAILEGNRQRLPERVRHAEHAIQQRLTSIQNGVSLSAREEADIANARRYLAIIETTPMALDGRAMAPGVC